MSKLPNGVAELRKSYREWRPTQKFIQWAREVESTPDETPTAEVSERLQLKPVDAKELFAGLKKLELAKFVVGRRGSASRLQWCCTLSSIAAVATGEADAFEPLGQNPLPQRPTIAFIKYVFQLRRDLKIEFALPQDLSQQDVTRLSAFLQTLPLENLD
jgi:hypothetical protein